MKSLSLLPDDLTISLSGGIDSSMIVFGLVEMGRKPEYGITFQVGTEENKDIYYSRKICKEYGIKQIISQIPVLNKAELTLKCKEVIKQTNVGRTIDTQCCFAYDYMLNDMQTKNIALGLYEGANFVAITKAIINYHRYKNNKITYDEYRNNYNRMRTNAYKNEKSNHVVIGKYIKDRGFGFYTPLANPDLVAHSMKFDYHDFHVLNDKVYWKYPLVEMFSEYFDKIGNHHNKKQFHVEGGLKKYHSEVLLPGSGYKNLNGVYGKMKKEINNESSCSMFFS